METPKEAEPLEPDQLPEDAGVDEASEESFPASDPPAFTHTHAGSAKRRQPS